MPLCFAQLTTSQHSTSRALFLPRLLFSMVLPRRSFEATEARTLRVVLSGFYDMTSVVARTFLEFDNPGQDR